MKNLENANMFIYNGAGLESWTDKVVDSLSNKDLKVVEASKGVELIKSAHDEDEEEHEHEEVENNKTTMQLKKTTITVMKTTMITKITSMVQWILTYGFHQRMQK
ncbi:metal ABC transporter solute-binding protein, Zn/Mn family [Peptoniphilus porci]|uniref:metal ABC transporter solute-binding protein, Zn/Mn family n=1 Tax=Peptoniphilus porci TaxID=2652280 RepID=UPI0022877052|nr:zinc ABC transporter substrate-binding protein [Peptoniphilus porci]